MPKLQPTIVNLRDTTTEQIQKLLIKAKFATEADAFAHVWKTCRKKHQKCGFDSPDYIKALRAYYRHKHHAKNGTPPPVYYSDLNDFLSK